MLLYPPFQVTVKVGVVRDMGYGWIFSPPFLGGIRPSVNVPLLLAQWLGVLLVGVLVFLFLNERTFATKAFETSTRSAAQPVGGSGYSIEPSGPDLEYAESIRPEQFGIQSEGPKGIGGWLLLLILGMTVFGPLIGAVRIYLELLATELSTPALVSLQIWDSYKASIWLSFLVFCGLSMWAGFNPSHYTQL